MASSIGLAVVFWLSAFLLGYFGWLCSNKERRRALRGAIQKGSMSELCAIMIWSCRKTSRVAPIDPPATMYTASGEQQFFMVRVDNASGIFNELLAATYHAKATQDRSCPGKKCPRTLGGCPCVQPGASPGLPSGYQATNVTRIENSQMRARYVKFKQTLACNRLMPNDELATQISLQSLNPPVMTSAVVRRNARFFEDLDKQLNEVYLWHGTSYAKALEIAQTNFKIDLAGANTGAMYGPGVYMAESSTKADEYGDDESTKNLFTLLLCRVCLGKFFYTTKRDELACDKIQAGEFDSICGDRLKTAGTFREFVVSNSDQIYPEYLISYRRMY